MLHVLNISSDEELKRDSLRHLDALQDGTDSDVNVLRRHVLGLHIAVRKDIEDGVL